VLKKEKAIRELQNTVDKNEKQEEQEKILVYDQLEIQARRSYKDVTQNQFKRINEIINDETRPLLERLRELFRRDRLTIGACIDYSFRHDYIYDFSSCTASTNWYTSTTP